MSKKYVFGVQSLDELIGEALQPPSLIVIAGNPGSGKTTLAINMCYTNAIKKKNCLYITLQEGKNKLLKITKNLGMDFTPLISKGLINIVELPVITSINDAIEMISKLIGEKKYDLVILDSINILLEPVEEKDRRAWLQNFFYKLTHNMNNIIILLAELPYGSEVLRLGSIEFVADVLLILKYKYEYGLLLREMEIRKARGTPIRVGKIPFTITNKGFRAFPPMKIDKLIFPKPKKYRFTYEPFKNYLECIDTGDIVYITYPPDSRSIHTLILPIDLVLTNNLKALLISYKYSQAKMKLIITDLLEKIGFSEAVSKQILNKYIIFHAFNPSGMSIAELMTEELLYIEEIKPDIIIFHGIELMITGRNYYERAQYYNNLVNQLIYLKSTGTPIIRFSSYIDDESYKINSSLSDVILKVTYEESDIHIREPIIHMWKRGKIPITIGFSELVNENNIEAWKNNIAKLIK
jgi:circadian clock protein KaiC